MTCNINDLRKKDFWGNIRSEISDAYILYYYKISNFSNAIDLEMRKISYRDKVFDSPIESYIYDIYEYAIGNTNYNSNISDTITMIIETVFLHPWNIETYPFLDKWAETSYLGFLIYYSEIRISVIEGNNDCTVDELAILSGIKEEDILEKIREGVIIAEKNKSGDNEIVISNEEVINFLKFLDYKIYKNL